MIKHLAVVPIVFMLGGCAIDDESALTCPEISHQVIGGSSRGAVVQAGTRRTACLDQQLEAEADRICQTTPGPDRDRVLEAFNKKNRNSPKSPWTCEDAW
jgi:hypothetical protein